MEVLRFWQYVRMAYKETIKEIKNEIINNKSSHPAVYRMMMIYNWEAIVDLRKQCRNEIKAEREEQRMQL